MSFGLFLMPETKGKHFEDIAEDFAKRTVAADPAGGESGEGEEDVARDMLSPEVDRARHAESAAEYYRRRSSLAY